jgi:hypothetical protein
MNIVLLLVLVLELCLGIAAWLSPQWLRSVAAHLLARADVLDLVRTEERRRLQFWNTELGIDKHDEVEISDTVQRARVLVRR